MIKIICETHSYWGPHVHVEARHWHRGVIDPLLLHLGINLKPRKKPSGSTPTLAPYTVILPPPRYLPPLQQPFIPANNGLVLFARGKRLVLTRRTRGSQKVPGIVV
jgi:hypothetical protein